MLTLLHFQWYCNSFCQEKVQANSHRFSMQIESSRKSGAAETKNNTFVHSIYTPKCVAIFWEYGIIIMWFYNKRGYTLFRHGKNAGNIQKIPGYSFQNKTKPAYMLGLNKPADAMF